MPFSFRTTWLAIATVFSICIVAATFAEVISNDLHLVPGLGGDGGKNIFTLIYHSLHGKGLHFAGMNYPYGEHIIYTDAQPLISVALAEVGCRSTGTALAVMWLLLLTSYILAIIFTFKTLIHFRVQPLLATIFAGLAVVMSPQLHRTMGHFGLGYACVIPMLFFWTIQYNKFRSLRYPVYILLLALIVNFLHPYLTAIVLVWIAFFSLGYLLFRTGTIYTKVRHLLPLWCSLALLFATITTAMNMTDKVNDRPRMPYGLTVYCTQGIDILTSYYSPVWKLMNSEQIQKSSGSEGFAYLGLVPVCIVIFMLIQVAMTLKKRKKQTVNLTNYSIGPEYLFMAVAALLLAMGVPFVWNMEWLVDYLGFIRQFRTLGRFAWIFYYIVTVYAAVVISRWYTVIADRGLANTIITLSLLLWSVEAYGYILSLNKNMKQSSNNFAVLDDDKENWPQFLTSCGYRGNGFQAILMLPFFHIGTDKLWVGNNVAEAEIGEGMVAGIQLGLPWVNAMMARSSWGIAQKQVKIAGGKYTEKPILRDIKSNQPFLLLYPADGQNNIDQEYLLRSSDYMGAFRSCKVYACYPQRIALNDSLAADSVKLLIASLLGPKRRDTCIGCAPGSWYFEHFDTGQSGKSFAGKGAMMQIHSEEVELLNISIPAVSIHRNYEFSCWFLLGSSNYRSPFWKLDFLDSAASVMETRDVLTKESTDSRGPWFRASAFFNVPAGCTTIRCRLRNEPDNTYFALDELLLKPAEAIVISRLPNGAVLANNHLLKN